MAILEDIWEAVRNVPQWLNNIAGNLNYMLGRVDGIVSGYYQVTVNQAALPILTAIFNQFEPIQVWFQNLAGLINARFSEIPKTFEVYQKIDAAKQDTLDGITQVRVDLSNLEFPSWPDVRWNDLATVVTWLLGISQDTGAFERWYADHPDVVRNPPPPLEPIQCPDGYEWDASREMCVPIEQAPLCPTGYHWDETRGECVPDVETHECPAGQHWDSAQERCVPDAGRFKLTLETGDNGSVSPAPGIYYYPLNEIVTIQAAPAPGYEFEGWLIPEVDPVWPQMDANPQRLLMYQDWHVKAKFRLYVAPPPPPPRCAPDRTVAVFVTWWTGAIPQYWFRRYPRVYIQDHVAYTMGAASDRHVQLHQIPLIGVGDGNPDQDWLTECGLTLRSGDDPAAAILAADPNPPTCPTGQHWDENYGRCIIDTGPPPPDCPAGQHWNTSLGRCVIDQNVTCLPGHHWDDTLSRCVPDAGTPPPECPVGWHWDAALGRCVIDTTTGEPPQCPTGYHWNDILQRCVSNDTIELCPSGKHWNYTLGRCVIDQNVTCLPGYHWDDDESKCVPD